MITKSITNVVHSAQGGVLQFNFMQGNMLKNMLAGDIMLNLFDTPRLDMAIANIFLRQLDDSGIVRVTPLLFHNDQLVTYKNAQDEIIWQTMAPDFTAFVTLSFSHEQEETYYYSVRVENHSAQALRYDLIYGQDLSLSDAGATKTNESYCSQYLDHKVFSLDKYGYTVSSRQNLPQSTGNPLLQLGSFSPAVGFSTDGYQFFAKQYKFSHLPTIVTEPSLENRNYQYEMAYVALQLQPVTLSAGDSADSVFYGFYLSHQPEANIAQAFDVARIRANYRQPQREPATEQASPTQQGYDQRPLSGDKLTAEEIEQLFDGEKQFVEQLDGELLSFFYQEANYVTLAEKERHLERPTGHIISSGNNIDFTNPIMNSTHYIYGVFNSHLTLGNTSFNKLLGVNRNMLNQFKSSGQRILVQIGGEYRILAMPSAYEVGANFSRWIYKLAEGMIQVRAFASQSEPVIQLDIAVSGHSQPLNVIVSHQLIMGNLEEEATVQVERHGDLLQISRTGDDHGPRFSIATRGGFTGVERYVDSDSQGVQYLLLQGQIAQQASIAFGGVLNGVDSRGKWLDFEHERQAYHAQYRALLNDFSVSFSAAPQQAQKLNHAMHWFTHNALTHYSSPHGLEQPAGAAWGTRDVSQGPIEFFMAMGRYQQVEAILCQTYRHQYLETGTWPQWFMFDEYAQVQQQESHGDIVVWPLKALADYLLATDRVALLDTRLSYTSIKQNFAFTGEQETLLQHVQRQIDHIVAHLVPGTYLSSYGDGDWDDTLQPANQSLRENMVSGWTIPLTLQTLKTLTKALQAYPQFADFIARIVTLTSNMEADYHKYLIKDGVISGFIHFNQGEAEYLLHPTDTTTQIKYRLLPAKRSIISESFDKEMAEQHMKIIMDNLMYPDGVRLMDRMAEYKAGKQTYFKRAELSANLGRENGLQYCHAHIRFIEALCKMGMAQELYDNLFKTIPVGIQESVPNAELRQANSYFSSSDAKFDDRYQAYNNFDQLKTGAVAAKAGWRIYSSGPGIYINQIVSNVLGVRYQAGDLLLDPVISRQFGDVTLNYQLYNLPVTLRIYPQQGEFTPKRVLLDGQSLAFTLQDNPYRSGAALIHRQEIEGRLTAHSQLEIYL
ncbi:cellobiose-phosphorylase [Yersinia pestis S3]|nr:cellobiose-phosphorylase [Yersinia pestis S3]